MKKKVLTATILIFVLCIGTAYAIPFTMNKHQLEGLYQTGETPDNYGTYLNSIEPTDEGIKVVGNILTLNPGPGKIKIGVNNSGIDYNGMTTRYDYITGTIVPLKKTDEMGIDLSGYDSYSLSALNDNENPWAYQLYFRTKGDYTVVNEWQEIINQKSNIITLDFKDAYIGGSIYNLIDQHAANYLEIDLDQIDEIGFLIGGDLPVGPNDYTFETEIEPIPEPATLLLLGIGLIGIGTISRKKFIR